MTKIYFIRHTNTEEHKNATQRARLTPLGIKQAEALAKKFKNKNIDVFYTSFYQRSRRVADIIIKSHKTTKKTKVYESKETLSEVDFRIKKRISLASFAELKNFYNQKEVEQIKNLLKAQKRAIRFVDYLFKAHPNQNAIVVTHGNIIKSIILGLLELKLSRFQRFLVAEGSITIIEGTSLEDVKITSINDTCHLEKIHSSH